MPLEILPDRFSEAKHEELDKVVNEAIGGFNTLSAPFQIYLLSCIIDASNGELNRKLVSPTVTGTLIDTYEDMRDMLSSAWELKSYRKIRNLAILAAPEPVTPFKGEYRGAAVNNLYEYLAYNEELFREGCYYAKFCSVIQSSGTGKSRVLTKLSNKDVVTIYMNLRDKDDKLSFPPRDEIPSRILTRFYSRMVYMVECYAFFIALFHTIEESLSMNHTMSNGRESVMCWVRQMCDMHQ